MLYWQNAKLILGLQNAVDVAMAHIEKLNHTRQCGCIVTGLTGRFALLIEPTTTHNALQITETQRVPLSEAL